MNTPPADANPLTGALAELAERVDGVLAEVAVGTVSDDVLLEATALLERIGRRADHSRVAVAGEIDERSRRELSIDGLAARKGCRSASELIQRVTRVSGLTASRRLALAARIRPTIALSGHVGPAQFPSLARAIKSGRLGVDSAAAITNGLAPTIERSSQELWAGAELELVAAAIGVTTDNAEADSDSPNPSPSDWDCDWADAAEGAVVACTADETRIQARAWSAILDADGIEPADEKNMRQRGLTLTKLDTDMVRLSGQLMPAVGAQLEKILSAFLNPKTAPKFETDDDISDDRNAGRRNPDPRSRAQRSHDILAGIIDTATRDTRNPTLGGSAPTVLVTVRERDLLSRNSDGSQGVGVGFVDGTPVPISVVKQFTCSGGTQQVVLDDAGRIIELGSPQRCFTPAQRRAITARDGGCIIPGCHTPAAWCEIHHVLEAAAGGPTHTDNGVLLCWFHHRTIDTSGWQIRMQTGVPHIKAPPWIDHQARWQRATKSGTRIRDQLADALYPETIDPENIDPGNNSPHGGRETQPRSAA
jgi:Domain of unknown function (DUF222)